MVTNKALISKNLVSSINMLVDQKISDTRVATFAYITAINDNQTLNAQPMEMQTVNNKQGSKTWVKLPEIQQIPYMLNVTPIAGDYCVLLHLDGNINTNNYANERVSDTQIIASIAYGGTYSTQSGDVTCTLTFKNVSGAVTDTQIHYGKYIWQEDSIIFDFTSDSNINGSVRIENITTYETNPQNISLKLFAQYETLNNGKEIEITCAYDSGSYVLVGESNYVSSNTADPLLKYSGKRHTLSNCVALCGFKNNSVDLEGFDSKQESHYNTWEIVSQKLLDVTYPIGSVYLTTNAQFNPRQTFGGFWKQLDDLAYLRIIPSTKEGILNSGNKMSSVSNTQVYVNTVTAVGSESVDAFRTALQSGYRLFKGVQYRSYIRFSNNPSQITYSFNTETNEITVNTNAVFTGFGVILEVAPNVDYRIAWSCAANEINSSNIDITLLTFNGSHISFINDTQIDSDTEAHIDFTTTSDTYYVLINFAPARNVSVTYINPILHENCAGGKISGSNVHSHGSTRLVAEILGVGQAFEGYQAQSIMHARREAVVKWDAPAGQINEAAQTSLQQTRIAYGTAIQGATDNSLYVPKYYGTYAWMRVATEEEQ